MITGKVWGATQLLLRTPLLEVHKLFILPKMQCSLHCHRFKWNAFYVISGSLSIEVQKNDYDLTDITELDAGDFTTVRPGEYHRFTTERSAICAQALEIYYPEFLSEDIVRKTCGGEILLNVERRS
jgi:mannose-6-phosphate isomerase-like protein (cupin superfamily)